MFEKGFCGWGEPVFTERLAETVKKKRKKKYSSDFGKRKKKAHKNSLCLALDLGGYLYPAWLLAGLLFLP